MELEGEREEEISHFVYNFLVYEASLISFIKLSQRDTRRFDPRSPLFRALVPDGPRKWPSTGSRPAKANPAGAAGSSSAATVSVQVDLLAHVRPEPGSITQPLIGEQYFARSPWTRDSRLKQLAHPDQDTE